MKAKSRVIPIAAPLLVLFVLFLVWQLGCTAMNVSYHLLPKPSQIFMALGRNFSTTICKEMFVSLRIMLLGYLIAVPLGLVLAALASQFKLAVRTLMPLLIVLMVTPMATLVPEFKLFLGVSPSIKVLVVVLQCMPAIAVNSITGFVNVSADKKNLMCAFGCGKWESFFRVVLPNALPQVFTGLKLGCILCTIAEMSADLSVGQGGLGYLIVYSSSMSATDTAYATIFMAALMGIVLYGVVSILEKYVITWK